MTGESDRALVREALARQEPALSELVAQLTPIIQARAVRCLLRCRRPAGERLREELKDLVQQVFLALFESGGRILASWEPERGLSLNNFVGLVTERQVLSILRSGKRDPWKEDPTLIEELDSASSEAGPEQQAASREELEQLLDHLRATLSPLGWRLFDLLYLQEHSVPEIERDTGLSAAAVYAWRSRLRRLAGDRLDAMSKIAEVRRIPVGER